MDPVSLIFSSYMDLVSNRVYTQMADMQAIELESLVVQHDDIEIPFSYQLWRIKPESVCDKKRHQVTEFSKCTVAAKSMFNEACNYLQSNKEQTWKHRKLKSMYCSAAC